MNRRASAFNALVAALVGAGALSSAGCDECQSGESECDGNAVRVCHSPDGDGPFLRNSWETYQCPVKCLTSGLGSGCVDSAQPVPECRGVDWKGTCFEGVPTSCVNGYPQKRAPCDANTQCVVSATCGATCVKDPTPEPRCAQRSFCDGSDSLVLCDNCGFVAARDTCGANPVCREMQGEAICTPSTPDPRCGDPTQEWRNFCDGNVLYACWFGYLVTVHDCVTSSSPPGRCEPVNTPTGQASCVVPG